MTEALETYHKNICQEDTRGERLREADPAAVEKRILGLLPCSARLLELIVGGDVGAALQRMIERREVAVRPDPLTGRSVVVDRRPTPRQTLGAARSPEQKAKMSVLFAKGAF